MIAPRPAALPYEVFDLERIAATSGTLHVADFALRGYGPFSRIFFLSGVPRGHARGGHAHKTQSEYVICIQGSVEVCVETRGVSDVVVLGRPGRALFLPPGCWVDLVNFSDDAVLAVLSADSFDESDYIRDRAAFRRWELGGR
ncbi:MAG TPA: FdtA/QdtA family cupin domain-containing protein [Candidatus Elarobacter sp.]|nr:FdtA/QdtA family cupin domain-containing protein [Candidatus Elarobacter sp.]